MKYFVLSLVLMVGCFFASAQVPGYVGKRHQFTYTPSVSMFNGKYRLKSDFTSMFYLSHQIGYDYVVGKKKTIGLFYDYNGTDFQLTDSYNDFQTGVTARYTRHQIGFAYRKYKRKSLLAPLGAYWKYTFSVARLKGEIDQASLPLSSEPLLYKYTAWDAMVGIGMGREFIIAKWVPLNIGIDIQLPVKSVATARDGRDLEHAVRSLTLATSIVKLNVSIGILAF